MSVPDTLISHYRIGKDVEAGMMRHCSLQKSRLEVWWDVLDGRGAADKRRRVFIGVH